MKNVLQLPTGRRNVPAINVEAERATLGGLLIDPSYLPHVAQFLRPGDFFEKKHQIIYEAMLSLLREKGTPADLVQLNAYLHQRGLLGVVGGVAYTNPLVSTCETFLHTLDYAYIVFENALRYQDDLIRESLAAGGITTAEATKRLAEIEARKAKGDQGYSNDHLDHLCNDWDGGILLSEVTPTHIDWLWNGYIPLGKLTMGDGDPGLGKSMLYAADLASRVTRGDVMPDGSPGIRGGAGVLIFTAEDAPDDTLQPRLAAAGGDLSKVMVVTAIQRPDPNTGEQIERLPTFSDLAFIERKIAQVNAKLVIFDPFMAYLPSGVNSNRDQDVRSALVPLARLAQKTCAAFLLIRHLNKSNTSHALYRGGGSIGIIGTARSGLLVVEDPDDENMRIFGSTKSNLGKSMPSWKYRIVENEVGTPVIQWQGQSERSAREVLNVSGDRNTTSKQEAACNLLRTTLSDGPHAEEYLAGLAKEQGISLATLRRAKKFLGVESEKAGIGRAGYWLWTLPTHNTLEDAHTPEDDHLSENVGNKGGQQADLSKVDHSQGYEHLSTIDAHVSARLSLCECGGSTYISPLGTIVCRSCLRTIPG